MPDVELPVVNAPEYPEWRVEQGVWMTSMDGQLVRVRLETEGPSTWRYVAEANGRTVLVEPFDVSEAMVVNIRSAWESLSQRLPEAMMEYLL